MIFFKLKGKVIHIYEVKNLYSSIVEMQYFQKQNIIVQSETELYTICFIDKKIELLKNVKVNSIVELEIKIKGRMWQQEGKVNSVNELVCLKLNFLDTEEIISQISYNDSIYDVKKYYFEDCAMLKIVNVENKTEINFSAVHSEKKDYILFSNFHDEKILKALINNKIVEHVYDIHQNGGASGFICKLLT